MRYSRGNGDAVSRAALRSAESYARTDRRCAFRKPHPLDSQQKRESGHDRN